MNHPFNTIYNTPFNCHPFDLIENDHFKPAIEDGIEKAQQEIAAIISNSEKPTFENTIEALEWSGNLLDKVTTVMYNLNSAETNDTLQEIVQEVTPALTKHSNDILLNEQLFDRIKHIEEHCENDKLTNEQQKLLENTISAFRRNGALLNNEKKQKLREINEKLADLSLNFGRNVLKDNNQYFKQITDKNILSGIPENSIIEAKNLADSKDLEGWIFILDFPSYNAVLTYADNRSLREEIYIAYHSKSFKNDALDNQKNVKQLSELRKEKANLLGYASHADFVLEKRMAETPETVLYFLENLLEKSLQFAHKELNQLTKFSVENGGPEVLQRWDLSYYAEKLKTALYEINSEILKPYFQLENVIEGVFSLSKQLFGLTFKMNDAIPVYHTEVIVYEVLDENNEFIALFYTDFFPRPGKRQGAWMTSFQNQFIKDGINQRPHVSIVCNFTKPIGDTPSLLTFDEVTTLFHEFGHALHGMLADTTYPSMSGTSVYWDFVELPSQLLENWCYEADCLQMFAKHYQTGELIPMEYVDRLKKSSQFNAGLATVRQVGLGLLDMAWHTDLQHKHLEVFEIERNTIKSTNLLPLVEGTCISTQFSHIFQGGYASGYYSYKWAEVLDADAFEYFKENSILNKEIALKLKDTVLSKGGTISPSELYRLFRGKNPDPAALLRRSGLLNDFQPKKN